MIVFKGDKRSDLHEDYALLPMWLVRDLLYEARYHLSYATDGTTAE